MTVGARVKGLGGVVVDIDRRLGCSGFRGSDEPGNIGWAGCGILIIDKESRLNAIELMDTDLRKVGRIDARFAAGTVLSTIWIW